MAARCGREGLRAGEGRGRWALGGCTRDGDRVGLSQLDGVQCCGLRLARAARGGGPAGGPPVESGGSARTLGTRVKAQGRAAAWLNFLCIDVVELNALVAPAIARLRSPIHRHRQSEALLDARTASAAQLAMSFLRGRRPHAAATTPTPASAHPGCVQIHREREKTIAQ